MGKQKEKHHHPFQVFNSQSVKDANLHWLNVKNHCEQQLKHFSSKISECDPSLPMKSTFRTYCMCRLPDTGDNMVQCTLCYAWFHYTCGPPNWTKSPGMFWFYQHNLISKSQIQELLPKSCGCPVGVAVGCAPVWGSVRV